MAGPEYHVRVRLEPLPAHAWMMLAGVLLALREVGLQVPVVGPYPWQVGTYVPIAARPPARSPLIIVRSMRHVLVSPRERTSVPTSGREVERR